MKITIKTTQQKVFQVEIDVPVDDDAPQPTIAHLKAKIQELQNHPVALQKLIFSGKILTDDKILKDCGIKEKDFLVLMVSKPKPSASASPSISTPPVTANPAQPPASENPVDSVSDPQTPAASNVTATDQLPQPATATVGGPAFGDNSSFLSGTQLETAVNNMIEMGFPREQVTRAMRASFNNPDRAVEYLMTGIPSHLAPEPAATPANPAANPANPTATPAPAPTSAVPNQPQNLFQLAQQQQQAGLQGPPLAPPNTLPSGGLNADTLRRMQQLRQTIAQNPAAIQPLLQHLAAADPNLSQNPEALIRFLAEDDNDGDDDGSPPGTQVINVTEEERAAIERLVALGFSRESAIQAYFACDKNEELAANYLFDNGFED